MKIELGKRYILRNGEITRRILAVDGGDIMYPIIVELEHGLIYNCQRNGRYIDNSSDAGYDLIKEYNQVQGE